MSSITFGALNLRKSLGTGCVRLVRHQAEDARDGGDNYDVILLYLEMFLIT